MRLSWIGFVCAGGAAAFEVGGDAYGFGDRMAMVRLACEGDVRFVATDVDAPRSDWSPNYTVDTLETLRREMPDATLFVLVGADSFLDLRRWRRPGAVDGVGGVDCG